MTYDTFDTITRSAGIDRRRSMLALGAAGLATTLAGTFGASAKQNAGKKARKRCRKQKDACEEQVTSYCTQFNGAGPQCQAGLLPCCDTCDVATGVSCVLNLIALA